MINKRKQLLAEVEEKYTRLAEIVRYFPIKQRVLVFSESIDSVERAAEVLRSYGVRCYTFHSKLSQKERIRRLKAWGLAYNVLLAVRCLDEGLDVPEVKIGIILASGTFPRQIVQRIGRLLRPTGEPARLYVIYCQDTVEERILSTIRGIYYGTLHYI